MKKWIFLISIIMIILGCTVLSPTPIYADTDGTELQVMQPSQLELQLGADWAGVEFELRTDVGLYPSTIVVDEDGVLRTEIGGSSTYILSCLSSPVAAPEPTSIIQDEASDSSLPIQPSVDATEESIGIPSVHIALFAGGLALAVGALVLLRMLRQRRNARFDENEYDDYED